MPPAEGARRLPRAWSPAARAAAAGCTSRRSSVSAFSGDQGGMIECSAGVIDATVLEFDDLAALDHWIGARRGSASAAQPGAMQAPPRDADPGAAAARRRARRRSRFMDGARRGRDACRRPAPSSRLRCRSRSRRRRCCAVTFLLPARYSRAHCADQGVRVALSVTIGLASALHQLLVGSRERRPQGARDAGGGAEGACTTTRMAERDKRCGLARRRAARRGAHGLQALEANGAALRRGDRAAVHYLRAWLGALEINAALAQREARTVAMAAESGMPWIERIARRAGGKCSPRPATGERAAQLRSAERATDAPAQRAAVRSTWWPRPRHGLQEIEQRPRGARHGVRAWARAASNMFRRGAGPRSANSACLRCAPASSRIPPARWLERMRLCRARRSESRNGPGRSASRPFGRFDLQRSAANRSLGQGARPAAELLKVLIALGGHSLRADQLADALWPHAEADYAHKSFTATLHLRRLLGTEEALLLRDARLSMNRSLLWVDTWALEQTLAELDETLRAPAPASLDVAAKLMDEVFALSAARSCPTSRAAGVYRLPRAAAGAAATPLCVSPASGRHRPAATLRSTATCAASRPTRCSRRLIATSCFATSARATPPRRGRPASACARSCPHG